ncbi:GtrA family protein, partial [Paenibacillus apiarius]|nr:GtrA family protein [Paenibacillus apiarius]
KYIILYSGTAITNILVNHLVLYILAMEGLAFLCATGVSTVLNFLGQKFFVFNNKREKKKDWLN